MGMEITIDGSHIRNVSAAAAETGAIARNGLDPSQPVMWNKAGDYFYQYDSPTSLNPPKEFNDELLAKRVKEDEQKREKEKKIQSPTSANPAPPELIPDESKAIAVCLSPDVCKSPDKPVPYMSWGEASDDQNYSPDVRSNGKIIKRQDSKFSCCYGDEPGVGLGCKSNTVGDVVEPVTSSQIVRANGIWVQRHGDRCTLNKGNTEGEYVHVEATDSRKAPEGTDKQDQSGGKAEDTRSEGQKFSDGFTENASETWEGLKKVGSDVLDGTKNLASDLWNDPTGTIAAGAESVKDGAVGAANWTAEVAQNLYDDPGATLGRGWENTQNTASSIWHAVADPYSEAYEKGGLSQAVGHGTFDAVKLAVEALATKGAATVAGKTASIGTGVAAKAHKAEEVAETVHDARKIESKVEDGAQGARSTRTNFWKRKEVNGRRVYQRDDLIDPNKKGPDGRTNLERMQDGDPPIGPDNKPVNLHHMTQDEPGPIAEVEQTFHKDNHRILHIYPNGQAKIGYGSAPPPIDRGAFRTWSRQYWRSRAGDFQ